MKSNINVSGLQKLGEFRNLWRGRVVTLYVHPSNPTLVVSVGVPATGEPVVCEELRSSYRRQLVEGDWSDFL